MKSGQGFAAGMFAVLGIAIVGFIAFSFLVAPGLIAQYSQQGSPLGAPMQVLLGLAMHVQSLGVIVVPIALAMLIIAAVAAFSGGDGERREG